MEQVFIMTHMKIDINGKTYVGVISVPKKKIVCELYTESNEADFYDKDFNGLSIKDVQDISRIDLEAEPYQAPPDTSYEVFELTDFDKISQYENYADWCILDETVFKAYTANGLKYFIAERSDFKEVPKLRGDDYPYDDYGMSLIIIGVEDNEIVSVTSRWNFDDTGDSYLKPQQLKKLLGRKYNFLFE